MVSFRHADAFQNERVLMSTLCSFLVGRREARLP